MKHLEYLHVLNKHYWLSSVQNWLYFERWKSLFSNLIFQLQDYLNTRRENIKFWLGCVVSSRINKLSSCGIQCFHQQVMMTRMEMCTLNFVN